MKEMIRFGSVLAVICVIASGLLAGVNSLTKARILAQAQAEEEAGLKGVLPEAVNFKPVKSEDEVIYYKGLNQEGKLVGLAFKASGKGYASTIETMAGMLPDGTITAIKVLSQNETPGLGSRVSEEDFTSRFKNKKDLGDIQAISGATISSRAVIQAVKSKAEVVKELIKNAK